MVKKNGRGFAGRKNPKLPVQLHIKAQLIHNPDDTYQAAFTPLPKRPPAGSFTYYVPVIVAEDTLVRAITIHLYWDERPPSQAIDDTLLPSILAYSKQMINASDELRQKTFGSAEKRFEI
jgi:hypothetical protein